jgi:prolipoprotein diacylglyceryltransferase
MLSRGGMSWFGGLFLGLTSGLIYLKMKGQVAYRILDLVVPFLALAQSLAGWAVFLTDAVLARSQFMGFTSRFTGWY